MSFVTAAYLAQKQYCPRFREQITSCIEKISIKEWAADDSIDAPYPVKCKYSSEAGCTYQKGRSKNARN